MWGAVLTGFCAGIISGMGIGGGTILIPALLFFTDISQHQAQGINLLYFIPTALVALFIHRKEGNLCGDVAKPLVLFGLLGAAAGAWLAVSLQSALLRRLFGAFLCLMGFSELCKKEKPQKQSEKQSQNPASKS